MEYQKTFPRNQYPWMWQCPQVFHPFVHFQWLECHRILFSSWCLRHHQPCQIRKKLDKSNKCYHFRDINFYSVLSCQYNRIPDESMPVFFYFGNLVGLVLGATVVVNYSNPTTELEKLQVRLTLLSCFVKKYLQQLKWPFQILWLCPWVMLQVEL